MDTQVLDSFKQAKELLANCPHPNLRKQKKHTGEFLVIHLQRGSQLEEADFDNPRTVLMKSLGGIKAAARNTSLERHPILQLPSAIYIPPRHPRTLATACYTAAGQPSRVPQQPQRQQPQTSTSTAPLQYFVLTDNPLKEQQDSTAPQSNTSTHHQSPAHWENAKLIRPVRHFPHHSDHRPTIWGTISHHIHIHSRQRRSRSQKASSRTGLICRTFSGPPNYSKQLISCVFTTLKQKNQHYPSLHKN